MRKRQDFSVLHMTDFDTEFPGSFIDCLRRLGARMASDNLKLVLVFPSHRDWQETLTGSNISVFHLPSPRLRNPLRFIFFLFRVSKLVASENVRIIHCHFGKDSKIFAVLLRAFFNRKLRIVWHWHNLPATKVHRRGNIVKRLFRDTFYGLAGHWVDRHVAISTELYSWLAHISKKVSLVPNGISLERFRKDSVELPALEEIRQQVGVTERSFVVCSVANFRPQKDHATLLKAAREVIQCRKDSTFLLVGDGPTREGIERLARTLGIQQQVIFPGVRRDVEKIVSISDVFVLSTHHEGFPYVLLEAMALEKPVVATDVWGCNDIVKEGVGFLVPPRDCQQLAERIIWLYDNRERATEMGRLGRRRIEQNYDLDTWTARIERLYLDLCE
ncbi:MAG: glycosyltransferase [Candidatus Eisenbacteria bacterium]|nr:glycosyltransferase [Candidatus Eisenbacteria bacterium]